MPGPKQTNRPDLRKKRRLAVQATWPNLDARHVVDPDKMLCLGILTRIEGDVFNLPPSLDQLTLARAKAERAVEQFQKALDRSKSEMGLAGNAVAYLLSPDNPGVTLDLIADYCGLTPETVLRKLLEPLDYDLSDFLQQKPGARCPLCEVSNARPDPERQALCLEKLGELQELLTAAP